MKSIHKKILFFLCFLIFSISGPILVLRSQGFRFDFERKRIVQTGGILIRAFPKQIKVFLNGKFQKETDALFGSAFIKNLLPKKHEISLEKEGYFSWKKEVEVREKELIEIKEVILYPKKLEWEKIVENIEDFWALFNQKKFLIKERGEEDFLLKIFDLEKNIRIPFLSKKDLSSKPFNLISLFVLDNEIRIKIEENGKQREFVVEVIKNLPKITEIIRNDNLAFLKTNQGTFWLKHNGEFYIDREKITNFSWVDENKDYFLEEISGKIFLTEIGGENFLSLYYFNPETQSFEKIFKNGKKIALSPNKKLMGVLLPFEIWIVNVENLERKFLLRMSKEIKDLFWINQNYLIFHTEDKIFISETDPKSLNLVEFDGLDFKKIWFLNKRLYLLTEDRIFSSQPLVP